MPQGKGYYPVKGKKKSKKSKGKKGMAALMQGYSTK